MYLDKLANGINPIDDSTIPDEDVVNNVRLSRCFFYISDILRKIIENEESEKKVTQKQNKRPFHLSEDQKNHFSFSADPINISILSGRINDLVDCDTMLTLKHGSITNWLMNIGMMYIPDPNSKQHTKIPTENGRKIGILCEERSGSNGSYYSVLYTEAAQHFILDHLDAIVSFCNIPAELHGQSWNSEHDRCLIDLYKKGVSISEIAITLKRNDGAIRSRLKHLGVK